ncbi:FUN14 domain-containing protein 1-like [Phlebotomus argentipes]|uniref:FUN14 domain-containing protein 1-like n=1 Tax=Phlebotomus argentipes TaxID=94469 RepID=UPI002892E1AC|nr:FUN14 domain-containing protein 1-like [Phlebotomus argentipes]XP_059616381.1 FUN14 domain-containing protein 1-like [Phlebotomus argentipes]XP_059616382.1 FUN14 domain-containing protein 1-like [Phlebotomus argentipes]
MNNPKHNKNLANITKMSGKDSGAIERFFGEISKGSATKQIALGAASGWLTGFVTVRVGRLVAVAVGGSIILLQIANEQGYIKVNWGKVNSKMDKIADKVEEAVTGEGPRWVDKAERYLDRKLDQAEGLLKKQEKKARKWYTTFIGDENGCKFNDFHIFLCAFAAGVAVGVVTAK